MMRRVFLAAAAAAALGALGPVEGTAQDPRGQEMTREEIQERIQREFHDRMARELALEPGEREELARLVAGFRRARAELFRERVRVGREAARFAREGESEGRALEILETRRELREREARLVAEEEERLLELLGPVRLLRMQVFREQFADRIRRLEAEGRPPRPGLRRR